MQKRYPYVGPTSIAIFTFLVGGCSSLHPAHERPQSVILSGERHFKALQQLTFQGHQTGPTWSYNNEMLAFQSNDSAPHSPDFKGTPSCSQIFKINRDGSALQRLTRNLGKTTRPAFYPDDSHILFENTLTNGLGCPTKSKHPFDTEILNPSNQIYTLKMDGTDPLPLEPGAPHAYHSDAATCHDGSVVFTSDRGGDLDLYTGRLNSVGVLVHVQRVTWGAGNKREATFSPDCKKITWRASHPQGKELKEYSKLLKKHLSKISTPTEIWIANADGTDSRQVTHLGALSASPTFSPDGTKVVFSSNLHDPAGDSPSLYQVDTHGAGLERISFGMDTSPRFSPDGKYLAFSSTRTSADFEAQHPEVQQKDMHVFIAHWLEGQPKEIPLKAAVGKRN